MFKKAPIFLLASAVLVVIIAGFLWQTGFFSRSAPLEKITIGSFLIRATGPVYIAQEQGYFKAQGLDVTVETYESSPESIKELKAGRVDLACCGAFNLVKEVLAGVSNLRCLTILSHGQTISLIAQPDKGIQGPEDLRGKTIGVPFGTRAEFFLGRLLDLHHIPYQEVRLVDFRQFDLGEALAAGKVDAIVVSEPITFDIVEKMGNAVLTWPAQEGQDIFWILAGREDYLKKNPAALEKLLRALEQAATFIKSQPAKAKAIICRRANFPIEQWDKYPFRYEVYLDQGLLLFMEDQAAWMIHNRLTDRTEIPDFLDYLDPGPLLEVKPRAVRLGIPGEGKKR